MAGAVDMEGLAADTEGPAAEVIHAVQLRVAAPETPLLMDGVAGSNPVGPDGGFLRPPVGHTNRTGAQTVKEETAESERTAGMNPLDGVLLPGKLADFNNDVHLSADFRAHKGGVYFIQLIDKNSYLAK